MRPATRPRTINSCAMTSPRTSAFSPITRPTLRTSPSTMPSIWMSPLEIMLPVTMTSALTMDGTPPLAMRLAWLAGWDAWLGGGVFGLENMAACLYEIARVADDIVIPDFVMDMRTGAAAGGADTAH